MNAWTFLPAALTLALSVVLGLVPLPLHPMWSAKILGTVAATTGLASAGTLFFVAVNYGATLHPRAADRLPEWALIGDDEPIPAALGVPATVLFAALCLTAAIVALRSAAEVRRASEDARSVLDTDVPIAVAVPGRNGGVLASRGLLAALDPRELRVVFEHEGAHLRHGHHRYLAVAALAAACVPPLRPLRSRLRFALERWADEEAAEAVGDREQVARTIARVALLQRPPDPGPLPAFADSGVVGRVRALLVRAPDRNRISGPALLVGTGLVTAALALTALQLDQAFGLTLR
ncbi:M56 family metallopeptidase [Actinocorallia sp. A-T 12471]|uniref:M56 family metallopeptidase n=1 Tax=Actinocorallia sp. A-T 12471 TaxID=3089813 RepID=UPI0029CCBC38|nr:M56 family metallopeptidase [Actinocorallia sp. A-T 12471]MDX6739491.1 M56 family metallopeptidase [Actinocorallia sp. A-T 12471]